MKSQFQPWQFLLLILAGWINRRQQDAAEKYLLMDRDTKFSEAFRVTLEQGGMEAVRLPPRSPNLRCFLTPGPMPRQRMRCVQLTIHVLATGRRTGHRAQLPHARGFPLPRSRPRFLPFIGSNRPSAA